MFIQTLNLLSVLWSNYNLFLNLVPSYWSCNSFDDKSKQRRQFVVYCQGTLLIQRSQIRTRTIIYIFCNISFTVSLNKCINGIIHSHTEVQARNKQWFFIEISFMEIINCFIYFSNIGPELFVGKLIIIYYQLKPQNFFWPTPLLSKKQIFWKKKPFYICCNHCKMKV